jgi:hypothetical protein
MRTGSQIDITQIPEPGMFIDKLQHIGTVKTYTDMSGTVNNFKTRFIRSHYILHTFILDTYEFFRQMFLANVPAWERQASAPSSKKDSGSGRLGI